MLPDCDKAIVLLHEIYGINAHIQRSAATWRSRGFDAYTPALFPHSAPFAYEQQEQAWRHFSDNVGFDTAAIVSLLAELRAEIRHANPYRLQRGRHLSLAGRQKRTLRRCGLPLRFTDPPVLRCGASVPNAGDSRPP
ncbi:dienelactone hydrolase family [Klebsiella michiganensis]|uniref:Dienelactone hydrolase family n=1 Tax=Klebsiella michiganensis TaxID=1134687 RepID=A0A7H4MZ28_9ENTR|nr:dienelactone hydrolase family [Klebsiella michiganensis]